MPETEGIQVWTMGGLPVVSTPDEIDLLHADDLAAALRSALGEHAAVIVDLTQTSFCDSSAISALVQGARLAAASRREMRIAVSAAQVQRVFRRRAGLSPPVSRRRAGRPGSRRRPRGS